MLSALKWVDLAPTQTINPTGMHRLPSFLGSVARTTLALLTLSFSACEDTSPLPAPVDFVGRDAGKTPSSAKPRDAGSKEAENEPSDESEADEAEADEADGQDEAGAEDEDEAEADADDTSATAASGADAGAGAPKDAGQRSDAGAPAVEAADCSTLTYESFGKEFVASYCIECHSGTSASSALGGVSLDSLANIQKNKMYLKKVTAPRTDGKQPRMPKGDNPDLTDELRTKFGAWVDCGPK